MTYGHVNAIQLRPLFSPGFKCVYRSRLRRVNELSHFRKLFHILRALVQNSMDSVPDSVPKGNRLLSSFYLVASMLGVGLVLADVGLNAFL